MFRELSFEEEIYVSGGMEDAGGYDGGVDTANNDPPSKDAVMEGTSHVCTEAYPGGVFCEAINPAVDQNVCVPDFGPAFYGNTVQDCISPAVASSGGGGEGRDGGGNGA